MSEDKPYVTPDASLDIEAELKKRLQYQEHCAKRARKQEKEAREWAEVHEKNAEVYRQTLSRLTGASDAS